MKEAVVKSDKENIIKPDIARVRLDKFVNDITGEGRSAVKKQIKHGLVSVNGVVVKSGDMQIDPNADVVTFGNRTLAYAKHHYYVMNKPAGVVSASKDKRDKTVMELLQDDIPAPVKQKLFVAGRLDKDTEGLLLLTDDGELAHRLLSPARHVEKTYYCRLAHEMTDEEAEKLEKGVDIGEKRITLPAVVKKLSDVEIELTITEGKFHQVKRMLLAVDNKVIFLKRIKMGRFTLPEDLEPTAYRALTNEEIEQIKL